MSAVRTTITIPDRLHAEALKCMEAGHYSGLSKYVQSLIRRDVEQHELKRKMAEQRLRIEEEISWIEREVSKLKRSERASEEAAHV